MPSFRRERANSFIQQELTMLLKNAIKDPRIAALTITEVELTQDRRIARVYVGSFGDEETVREGLEGLESAKGFLRRKLGESLHWRFTPELEFRVDRSWQYGAKIDAILESLKQEEEERVEPEQDAE
ncbi:MAG: 30S ribosome-binding factor RbfA [Chloroflexi bacterium]|jgi:ribosome-binding factor A|nr:30S ribosome-binding factor RbfA [Chloroflexota bacterium]